ncbi:hypothetical protein GCM10010401_13520 [Rarobacter faecitabidus]|uniref:Uncharacterized protein n=1 Tax=Rarobacter faecitabidus TaxID=13243 RepID=A0A542ZEA4_RARFA|nr:hypothetical protein [Rarobacter faecitabidus]TQL58600.1 hypothetical protein FB461_2018 [Rarobacter faecitabidus]
MSDELNIDQQDVPDRRGAPIANVRRAPRLGRFVVSGAAAGIVLGVLASVLASLILDHDQNLGFVIIMTALAGVIVGGLLGAYLAVRADRKSTPTS